MPTYRIRHTLETEKIVERENHIRKETQCNIYIYFRESFRFVLVWFGLGELQNVWWALKCFWYYHFVFCFFFRLPPCRFQKICTYAYREIPSIELHRHTFSNPFMYSSYMHSHSLSRNFKKRTIISNGFEIVRCAFITFEIAIENHHNMMISAGWIYGVHQPYSNLKWMWFFGLVWFRFVFIPFRLFFSSSGGMKKNKKRP